MQIFIDTADIAEIKEAISWGIVDGVTTNPSLLKKSFNKYKGDRFSFKEYIEKILNLAGPGCPVSLEVIGVTEEAILHEAHYLFETFNTIAGNVVIKVPINPRVPSGENDIYDGLKALKRLHEEGIPTNCTLVMSPEQALLAAKAGANYISPFAGRIDDDLRKRLGKPFDKTDYFPAEGITESGEPSHLGQRALTDGGILSGVDLCRSVMDIIAAYDLDSLVIAASIRNSRQARELAEIGSDIATIPFPVIQDMLCHHKSEEGMAAFLNDVVPEYRAMFQ